MPNFDERADAPTARPARGIRTSIKRGFRGCCPACGTGRLLRGYLGINDACPACGEELHHHRADDFPQYVTILIVSHILIAALLAVDEIGPELPLTVHYLVWPVLVIALSLVLLPKVKGALVAYQWALRMHGFETAHCLVKQPLADQAGADSTKLGQRSAA